MSTLSIPTLPACLIATATRANILALWRQLIVGQGGAGATAPQRGETAGPAPAFPEVSATIPPGAAHLGESVRNP